MYQEYLESRECNAILQGKFQVKNSIMGMFFESLIGVTNDNKKESIEYLFIQTIGCDSFFGLCEVEAVSCTALHSSHSCESDSDLCQSIMSVKEEFRMVCCKHCPLISDLVEGYRNDCTYFHD